MNRLETPHAQRWAWLFLLFGAAAVVGNGILALTSGQIVLGWFSSGLLYIALGLSIRARARRSTSPAWILAAFPIAITPAGLVILALTITFTVWIRRRE